MRITAALALTLALAVPALAQDAAPPAPPIVAPQDQARADALMVQAIERLIAGQRTEALPLVTQALAIAGPAEDIPRLEGQTQFEVYSRWLAARTAAMKARDFKTFARWAWLTSAYRIKGAAARASETGPVPLDDIDDIFFMTYGLVLAGEEARARAFIAPFAAATNPAFEQAFARDIAQRAQSVVNWGGEDKPRARRLTEFAVAMFDRPGARAEEPVRNLYRVLGQIRRTDGDFAGARAAYVKARKAGAPPADAELALMFAMGETDAGIAAVQRAIGESPSPTLSRAAADKLIDVAGQTGSGNAATLAIYERVYPVYQRTLKPGDIKLESAGSVLARLYLDTGEPGKSEAILAPLLASAEKRWGVESNGALGYVVALAKAIEAQARYGEAELLYRRIWDLSVKYSNYEGSDTRAAFEGIARILLARGERAEALAFTTAGIAKVRAEADLAGEQRMFFLLTHALALEENRAFAPAEQVVREALALGESDEKLNIAAMFDSADVAARARLAHLLELEGRAAQAEPIRRLLLKKIEQNDMIPWEGEYRREALLALANNLTLQGKAEGTGLFAERLAASTRIYGTDSPQALDIAEPFARALLRSGRPGAALTPARVALAARTSARFEGDAARANQSDMALARKRADAARLMIQAAWKASRVGG
ncbi:hypothetical protein [Sphingomonas sp.]|uniref:hypothetical protein n=1 Tax=Sphingomonas sp. TaxID=28214 RepID=UPI001ECC7B1B|nr:hypothetical protein [Sphingomonas sp.]MBX3594167.1 hypothetical protein [Sphingomonas sp.]